ncbi:hypothetical protein BCR34DRAFT_141189 [Clohesyomyces aquaticus]|uniref:Uncharacterized protein n=1 Tax=Clohesyomyces aquaticus TaxID=1231657 RepID=A0A1Y1YMA7_9PLEO|nr:hypothetical protein BCR34DRAFT_141189 [Clohesyomyces aquaticus]
MCRIEERVYRRPDGTSELVEVPYRCQDSRHGKLCSNVTTIEYVSQPPSVTRDDASSPASYNPPTPTGTGTYLVQKRQPSGISRRPSTRDGTTRAIKPEIIISIGGSKKDKGKGYTSAHRKRASLGASSIASSNEVHIDSPGSDASYTVRTGFPEAPLAPVNGFSQSPAYTTITTAPKGHHRHTSSASSYTNSSRPPSFAEPDSPSTRRAPRYPPTIVHNPPTGAATGFTPSSPTVTRAPAPSSPSYRVVAPKESTQPGVISSSDGLFPTDYAEFHDRSGSSNGSFTRAVEITDRDADRARQRKLKSEAEKKKRQEEADEILARQLQEREQKRSSQEQEFQRSLQEQERKHTLYEEELKRAAQQSSQQEQEQKQVRFELGRADARAKERAENQYAENEKRRAEDREEARRKQREQREREERAAKDAKKEKPKERNRLEEEKARRRKQQDEQDAKDAKARATEKRDPRPPTRDPPKRHSTQSRRNSVSQEYQQREREKLLAETQAQMAREREAADQRDREERAELLRQQQETSQSYWSPRRDDRYPVANENPGVGRRNSVSGRRSSISSNAPMGLGRTNSKRVSIHQPAPPAPINTSFQQTYATRPQSSHFQQPPTPLFSPPMAGRPGPSARRPSYSGERPSYNGENPFTPQPSMRHSPPMVSREPWDTRDMREALPREAAPAHHRQVSDDRHPTLRRRGEDDINKAKQATHKLGKAVGYENDYAIDDSEDEEDRIAGYGPRLGMGKHHGRRKN